MHQKEGQGDIGLVNRIGNFQAGAFASFKTVSLRGAGNTGTLAQGAGGYLKTNPNGRYLKGVPSNKRAERLLLNLADFMGVTNWDTFGDIGADFKPYKTPLAELKA